MDEPKKLKRLDAIQAILARAAAQSRIPSYLLAARRDMPVFEDRAVKAVVDWAGLGTMAQIRREAGRAKDDSYATFSAFHEVHSDFPCRLTAGRLKFDYDDIATALLNDPHKTPMWSAWVDAKEHGEEARALIFNWPRVKRCRGWCVFHDVARVDDPVGLPRKAAPWFGFRIVLPILGSLYSLEPLPAFLCGIGWYKATGDESEDEDGG